MIRLAFAAALLAAGLSAPAAARTLRPIEVRIEPHNNRYFVRATVNGSPVLALLDSGAEMTVLDDDFAARLGLTASGGATARGSGAQAMQARFAQGLRIGAAGLSLPNRTAAVLDLGEVSARLVGRPVEMILGRDLFDAARLRIDLQAGTMRMVYRSEAPGGVRLPLTAHRGIETMPVRVEGHEAAAAFDLGNGSEVMISRAFAERIGAARPDRIVERRTGGGLGGAVARDIVHLNSLIVGGVRFDNVPAAIDDGESAADVNVGTQMLRRFLITADFPERTLWLEPK